MSKKAPSAPFLDLAVKSPHAKILQSKPSPSPILNSKIPCAWSLVTYSYNTGLSLKKYCFGTIYLSGTILTSKQMALDVLFHLYFQNFDFLILIFSLNSGEMKILKILLYDYDQRDFKGDPPNLWSFRYPHNSYFIAFLC